MTQIELGFVLIIQQILHSCIHFTNRMAATTIDKNLLQVFSQLFTWVGVALVKWLFQISKIFCLSMDLMNKFAVFHFQSFCITHGKLIPLSEKRSIITMFLLMNNLFSVACLEVQF